MSSSASAFVPRPYPAPSLAGVPKEYILSRLRHLAPHYWNKPETADCTIGERPRSHTGVPFPNLILSPSSHPRQLQTPVRCPGEANVHLSKVVRGRSSSICVSPIPIDLNLIIRFTLIISARNRDCSEGSLAGQSSLRLPSRPSTPDCHTSSPPATPTPSSTSHCPTPPHSSFSSIGCITVR